VKLLLENWREYLTEEKIGRAEQYIKHAALNLGIAARQGKNILVADDGRTESVKELAKALYYTLVRPWTHHTDEELQSMADKTVRKWFDCGYMESDEQYEEECL
jgi:hypothetical protein